MATVESSLEGSIEDIQPDGNGGAVISALGVKIQFTPSVLGSDHQPRITSPTRNLVPLTVAELLFKAKFPGRDAEGFKQGTVIAEGTYDTDTNTLLADSIAIEPGETVLLGALTLNLPGAAGSQRQLAINGTPIIMLTDARLPSNRKQPTGPITYYNQYALPMDVASAKLAKDDLLSSSAEGYYGKDISDPTKSVFYAFLFEYGGTGTLLEAAATRPQISIERAVQFRDRGASIEVEARGVFTTSHINGPVTPQQLKFTATDENGTAFDLPNNLDVRFDVPEPGFIRWRLRDRYTKVGNLANIPVRLRVENVTATNASGITVADEYEAEFRAA